MQESAKVNTEASKPIPDSLQEVLFEGSTPGESLTKTQMKGTLGKDNLDILA